MKLTDENGKEYEFKGNRYAEPITMGWHGALVELPPKPKKIDMSVCIDSGIDCLFWDNRLRAIAPLKSIQGKCFKDSNNDGSWKHCRPRMNHVHASPNGWDKCPVPEGFVVKAWGKEDVYETKRNDFLHHIPWKQVIIFEVTGIAEGYTL